MAQNIRAYEFLLIKQVISRDKVRGLPRLKFLDNKVCEAYVKGKQTKSSFKLKKQASTSRPLKILHMDLYRPIKVQSIGGKKYVLIIVDNYSRFTWTMFIRTKDETYGVLVAFAKKIQVRLNCKIVEFRFDHGTEFKNFLVDDSVLSIE